MTDGVEPVEEKIKLKRVESCRATIVTILGKCHFFSSFPERTERSEREQEPHGIVVNEAVICGEC